MSRLADSLAAALDARFDRAEEGDPALAGLEPGDLAWYAPNGDVYHLAGIGLRRYPAEGAEA